MSTISHILVPTDFSPVSEQALDYALDLAKRLHASVHVLHVVDSPLMWPRARAGTHVGPARALGNDLIDRAADRLAESIARRGRVPVRVTGEVRVGAVVARIREVARDQKAGVIVMGTYGRAEKAHLVLGTVPEEVTRHTACPVLMVRAQGQASSQLSHEAGVRQMAAAS